ESRVSLTRAMTKGLGGEVGDSVRLLAEHLASEFSAPIGVFDPDHRTWRVMIGAPEECFPETNPQLQEVASSSGLRLGTVALWHRNEHPEVIWLVMPLLTAEVADLVAFAGFRASARVRNGVSSSGEARTVCVPETVRWGPMCPDPALRAWGQQTINRL